jgi:hypothetical protein
MIYYENHKGAIVRFDGDNLRVKENDLRDFAWSFNITNKPSGFGSRVNRFSRHAQEKEIKIIARGHTRAECVAALNNLHAICEADISATKPGRLYLDGQFLFCFLGVSSEINSWRGGYHFVEKTLSILAVYPFWYTEVTQQFRAGEIASSTYGKRYNGRYPYQYGTGYTNKTLYNTHYAAAPAVITIYGPCEDPQIYIAGNLYGVLGVGADNQEHIILDQVERTIYRVSNVGEITNLFDYRVKTADPFAYIPAGDVPVQFSGEFGFDVKLMQQRSEPKWI